MSAPRTFFMLKLMPTRWMGTLQAMLGGLTAHSYSKTHVSICQVALDDIFTCIYRT